MEIWKNVFFCLIFAPAFAGKCCSLRVGFLLSCWGCKERKEEKTAAKNFFKKVLVESKKQLYICSRFEKQVVLKKELPSGHEEGFESLSSNKDEDH